MADVGVVCLLSDLDEAPILRELTRPGSGIAVRRRCLDAAELLGLAEAGIGDIAVLTPRAPGVEAAVVRKVREAGLAVAVIGEAAELAALGAGSVSADACLPPGEVARLPETLRELRAEPAAVLPRETTAAVGPPPSGPGRIVAVWGTRGAPGRTTLAVNLAAEFAHRDQTVLLVDADPAGGGIAPMLGLLDESPGILAAARLGDGELTGRRLARLAPLAAGMRVLTGIDGPDRADELQAAPLAPLWPIARQFAEITVVDCGGPAPAETEPDEAAGAVDLADDLVIVGRGDPLGVHELVRALAARSAQPWQRRLVVVNRVRPSAIGGRPGPSLRHALRRFAGVTEAQLLPDDVAAVDRAVLRGRTLREDAPDAPLTRAIELLADEIMARGPLASAPTGSKDSAP